MSLNLSKTKVIVFRNGGIVKDAERWFYIGNEIEEALRSSLFEKFCC